MRIGLVVNMGRRAAVDFASRFAVKAAGADIETLSVAEQIEGTMGWTGDAVDLIVAVGGDGTVLEAVRKGMAIDSPVLGFNLGTIGFLAEAEPDDLALVVDALAAGSYRVEERMTLGARLNDRDRESGVNDVVVEKIESQRLVVLTLLIDGESFLTYRADGLVFATATGSTAYAFSAGGPLVDPRVESLLVTPVAPHSLFGRTLVLPPDSALRCRVDSDRSVRVSVDGVELGTLHEGQSVEVARGPVPARFVRLDGRAFPARVSSKFGLV